jgi:hypothetical protein
LLTKHQVGVLTQPIDSSAGLIDPPGAAEGEEDAGEGAGEEEGEEALPTLALGEGGASDQVHINQGCLQPRSLRRVQILQNSLGRNLIEKARRNKIMV